MEIKGKLFLAPMENFTNAPFRILCKKYGADYREIPLVSAKAISKGDEGLKQIDLLEDEKNVGVQLFGSEPEEFIKAGMKITEKFPKINWIDINAGCPSPKVMASGGGANLLKYPRKVKEIVYGLKELGIIVSIKIRIDYKYKEVIRLIQNKIDFITIHGRKVKERYSGKADWKEIKKIKEEYSIPTVGNGDIYNQRDIEEKKKEIDGLMIGRGALRNPKIFFKDLPKEEESRRKEIKEVILEYMKISEKAKMISVKDLKLKTIQMINGFKGSKKIREIVSKSKEIEEIKEIISKI